jgi:hypothetical protein
MPKLWSIASYRQRSKRECNIWKMTIPRLTSPNCADLNDPAMLCTVSTDRLFIDLQQSQFVRPIFSRDQQIYTLVFFVFVFFQHLEASRCLVAGMIVPQHFSKGYQRGCVA